MFTQRAHLLHFYNIKKCFNNTFLNDSSGYFISPTVTSPSDLTSALCFPHNVSPIISNVSADICTLNVGVYLCICLRMCVCECVFCPHKHELTFGLCFLGCSEGSGCSYSTPCVCVCLASQMFKVITFIILVLVSEKITRLLFSKAEI